MRTMLALGLCVLGWAGAANAQGRIERLDALFERLRPAVVTVRVGLKRVQLGRDGANVHVGVGTGSGVLLHGDGYVATAAHVVEDAEVIEVEFSDGTKASGGIVTLSRTEDLALLSVDRIPARVLVPTLGDSDAVKPGQPVFAIGAPMGLRHSLTAGVISGVREDDQRSFGPKKALQTDAALNQGNSGGPLFNERGEVIGIASFIATVSGGSMGLGFAIPSNVVRQRLFEQPLPWMGLSLRAVPRPLAEVLNWPIDFGLLVEKVRPDTPASRAGLRGGQVLATFGDTPVLLGGDVLLSANGVPLSEPAKVAALLSGLKEGDSVRYQVLRGGKTYDAEVMLPDWKRPPPLPPLKRAAK